MFGKRNNPVTGAASGARPPAVQEMPAAPARRRNPAIVAAGVALAAACAGSMLHPATLQTAHRIIEELIH